MEDQYQKIVDEYKKIESLSPKERYKRIKSIAYLAGKALPNCNDLDELSFYTVIFKKAMNSRLMNKALAKQLQLKGITEIKTLKTQLTHVEIESGLMAVGDPELAYKGSYDLQKAVEAMNKGDFYCIGTGGDGTHDVILRLVDCPEPLATPKEHKFIINNSEVGIIRIVSGKIKCSDFCAIGDRNWHGAEYEVDNGFYKVCFYQKDIRDKFYGYIVVLAKIDQFNSNQFKDIEGLG
jgi:hypothetical protein